MNKMDEFHIRSYESSALQKEMIELYHDWKIKRREFHSDDLVLLYNS